QEFWTTGKRRFSGLGNGGMQTGSKAGVVPELVLVQIWQMGNITTLGRLCGHNGRGEETQGDVEEGSQEERRE
ncbi:hypothetical protein GBF38_004276, partial [Nibea albiflora]